MVLQGSLIDYAAAFLGGVVVSFSPCVFPLVPIILSFIGVKAGKGCFSGLSLSLIYVLGLAVTYSILGLIASLTGRLFGQISTHPVSFIILGNICILAGLSFFDAINFGFIGVRLQDKIKNRGGYFSTFLLGAASGLAAGPCTTPALGMILVYVASRRNIIYGASLLFVFAYGMGFLLILVGTFGSAFMNLANSEVWLNRIKKLGGFILIAAGEYFLIKAGRLML